MGRLPSSFEWLQRTENALLHWLVPLEVVFIVLSMIAGSLVVLGAVKVRIDVKIEHVDTSRKGPGREG